jgi:hypothetical protein
MNYSTDFRNDNVTGGVGLSVLAAGSVNDFGSYPIVTTNVAGTLYTHGTHLQSVAGTNYAVNVLAGGKHYGDGDFYDGANANFGTTISSTGTVSMRNTKMSSSTTSVLNGSGGVFLDGGNNTIPVFSGSYQGKATIVGKITNPTVPNRNSSLGATTLLPATGTWIGATVPVLTVSLYAMDGAPFGASCTGNTTVLWTISYTDAGGNAKTQTATETITTNGVAGADQLATQFQLYISNNTAITYSTTVTPGSGCSPVPSYTAILGVQ